MPDPRRLLDRFHRVLVEEIRASHPEYLESTFTVAEIYQNLVPYRTHRDALGVEMNGDYEDALVRLLAGEGDFLLLESEPARRRIEAELRTSNPNTTVYREFAAAPVRLNPERVPAPAGVPGERPRTSGRAGAAAGEEVLPAAPDRAAPVNPELGLFVADLFGGSGEEGPGQVPPDASAAGTAGEGAGRSAVAPRPGAAEPVLRAPESPVGLPPTAAPTPPPAPTQTAPSTPPASEASPPPSPPSSLPPAEGSGAAGTAPTATPVAAADPRGVALLLDENLRLRRIVADQALEIQRLRERLAAP